MNTLPVRIRIGEEGAEASVRRIHLQLAELMRHEHARWRWLSVAAQVPAPTPLFSALLNYRHSRGANEGASEDSEEKIRAREGIRRLAGEGRTNYPFTLSVDDLGEGFGFTAQVVDSIEPMRVCRMMHVALASLVEALEGAPTTAVSRLKVADGE